VKAFAPGMIHPPGYPAPGLIVMDDS